MTLRLKEVAIICVFILFTLPALYGALNFASDPSDEKLAQVVADVAVPWWVNIMVAIVDIFENHPYLLIIAFFSFVFFLKWIGEIK
jgi:ABC-type amino acid transport system permease subunit